MSDVPSLNQLISRLLQTDFVEKGQSNYVCATVDALVKSKVNDMLEVLNDLEPYLREECLDTLMTKETGLIPGEVHEVLPSVKEVVTDKRSKSIESERIRSTLISAACGPNVNLKAVSTVLGIYKGDH